MGGGGGGDGEGRGGEGGGGNICLRDRTLVSTVSGSKQLHQLTRPWSVSSRLSVDGHEDPKLDS